MNQFQKEAALLRDPKAVGQRLTDTAQKLCQSPALFFGFHEGIRAAILQCDSGFAPGQSPAGMSFPIDASTLERIVHAGQSGPPLRLTEYPPLSKMLMARVGVAHFDAWPLTGYGHLGRVAGKPRLLGILVILQAGAESATRQDSLGQMMRASGLIYENTLLAQ